MRRLVPFLVVLTAFLSPLLHAQEDVPEIARSLLEEAERAREAGRDDEAIARYQRVLEVAPSLASAYVNLGALYFNNGKVDQAYETFVRGLNSAPADRALLSNAASTAQQLGKREEALRLVDRALQSSPRDAPLHALRSTILRSLQRNDDALAALQQAVQISPADAKLQFSLGNLLYQLGRKPDAIAAYRKAVDTDRSYLRAWYNLGAVLFESGNDAEALDAYRVALAPVEQSFARKEPVDPIHARAYANLGAIYLRQKQLAPAADAYQKALRLAPADGDALYNLAFIDYSSGSLDRAEEEYRKALAADPTLPLAYLHLGDMAWRRGDAARAIQILQQGMPRFDAESRLAALHIIGRAQLARGDRAGAGATYAEIARLAPDDPDATTHFAYQRMIAARDAGEVAAERLALETLMARGATDAMRTEHALLLVRQGEMDAARSELKLIDDRWLTTLRAALGENADLRDAPPLAAAILDARAGNAEAAARKFADMHSPVGRGNAGLLYWQLGREAEARSLLAAAHAAMRDWNEVTIALGEIALSGRRYEEAIDLLSNAQCSAAPTTAAGTTLQLTLGSSDDLCGRQQRALNAALLSQAADELPSAPRRARQLAERAGNDAIAFLLRGTASLQLGELADAREELGRAINNGLPPTLLSIARRNLDAAQPAAAPAEPPEAVSAQPRRVVVVFLPDAPVDNDRSLAGAINEMLAPAMSTIPLQIEFFRRADDARAFLAANRDRVGMLIANSEFVSPGLTPRFQFARGGKATYERVVVVQTRSHFRSLNDLRGQTMSIADVLSDVGDAEVVRVPDDLTAIANVLFGKSAAALISEANPLLAQRRSDLRVIATTSPHPLPFVSFAAMPESDRTLLDARLRSARSVLGILVPVARAQREEPKREVVPIAASALSLRMPERPARVALRVSVELPKIEIPHPLEVRAR